MNNKYMNSTNSPFINRTNLTLSTNHPLIENTQDYLNYSKYLSINSADRDIIKYPNSSVFEIELPEDYLNVMALRLYTWTIPRVFKFDKILNNDYMIFKLLDIYNPGEHGLADPLQNAIFQALYNTKEESYTIFIENGNYTPEQMAKELTNKFNESVTNRIIDYFNANGLGAFVYPFSASGGYKQFEMAYNIVTEKLWFGNRSSTFILENNTVLKKFLLERNLCPNLDSQPSFKNWGLPSALGLSRCDTKSSTDGTIPRFYYGNVFGSDNGYWLIPDPSLPGSKVSYIEAESVLDVEEEQFLYLDLDEYNCGDQTSPYNLSNFTFRTNQTNGIVNSYFAVVPYNRYDDAFPVYKFFYPPAERIRKFKIKLKTHDGTIANLGNKNYTLILEFVTLIPQQLRKFTSQNTGFARTIG